MKNILKTLAKHIGICLLMLGFGFMGYKIGIHDTTKAFHKELIGLGYAQYNSQTGEWQYKTIEDVTESQPSLFDMPKKPAKVSIDILNTPNIVEKKIGKKG